MNNKVLNLPCEADEKELQDVITNSRKSIGSRLKILRKACGLTISEASKNMVTARSTISDIEEGVTDVMHSTFARMESYYLFYLKYNQIPIPAEYLLISSSLLIAPDPTAWEEHVTKTKEEKKK